jgi:hypothetical protein
MVPGRVEPEARVGCVSSSTTSSFYCEKFYHIRFFYVWLCFCGVVVEYIRSLRKEEEKTFGVDEEEEEWE